MNKTFILYIVTFVAFLGPFSQNIYTPILPEVTSSFKTSFLLVNVTISIYTLFLAIMQIVYGPLADSIGRKKVLLIGLLIYIVASIGCFFSYSIYLLIMFRALQALGIAAGSVVAITVIGDLFKGEERGKAMATFQMLVTMGPVIGPVTGGFLAGSFDFHSVFLVLTFIGIVVFIHVSVLLKETIPEKKEGEHFSPKDFASILKNKVATTLMLFTFVQFYAYYQFLIFLPTILNKTYALSAEKIGLMFLPMTISIVVGSFIGGRIQSRFQGVIILFVCTFAKILSIFLFIWTANTSLLFIVLTTFSFGLFVGISLPVQTNLLTKEFEQKRATAVGVYNFFRYIGMALGPIIGTVFYHLSGVAGPFVFTVFLFFIVTIGIFKLLSFSQEKAGLK